MGKKIANLSEELWAAATKSARVSWTFYLSNFVLLCFHGGHPNAPSPIFPKHWCRTVMGIHLCFQCMWSTWPISARVTYLMRSADDILISSARRNGGVTWPIFHIRSAEGVDGWSSRRFGEAWRHDWAYREMSGQWNIVVTRGRRIRKLY